MTPPNLRRPRGRRVRIHFEPAEGSRTLCGRARTGVVCSPHWPDVTCSVCDWHRVWHTASWVQATASRRPVHAASFEPFRRTGRKP